MREKKRIRIVGQAISSLLKQLKEAAQGRFEIKVRGGEIGNCFPMIASYCCDIPESKNIFAIRQRAGRRQSCVVCHSTYEDRVRGKKISSRMVIKTKSTSRITEKSGQKLRACVGGGVVQESVWYRAR